MSKWINLLDVLFDSTERIRLQLVKISFLRCLKGSSCSAMFPTNKYFKGHFLNRMPMITVFCNRKH